MSGLSKFSFDTEFDAGGDVSYIAPRPKRSYSADEVEHIRQTAHADGVRDAMASIAAAQAEAVAQVAAACRAALPRLAEVAHDHRTTSAGLALACGQAIADAALRAFPEAPIRAALDTLAREIEAQPRLVATVQPDLVEAIRPLLEDAVQSIGFSGALQVRGDGAMASGAFSLDFGDGQARFDPAAAAGRVAAALDSALAAEGLHAEPLIPAGEI